MGSPVTDPRLAAALDAELEAAAQRQQGYAQQSWPEQAYWGARGGLQRAGIGLKGMVTDLSPQDLQDLQTIEEYRNATGPAEAVGRIGFDVLAQGAPIARGMRGVYAATQALPGVARGIANTLGAAGLSGGVAAALEPQDRMNAATGAALGGAAGEVGGQLVSKFLGGFMRPTPEAADLLEQGIRLTPGQAAGTGHWLRSLEESLKKWPVVGGAIKGRRTQALADWNQAMISRATPPTFQGIDEVGRPIFSKKPVVKIGPEAMSDLHQQFRDTYTRALAGREFVPDDRLAGELDRAAGSLGKYYPRLADEINGARTELADLLPGPTDSGAVQMALDVLDGRISSAYATPGLREAADTLKAMRTSVMRWRDRQLPDHIKAPLRETNLSYARFLRLRDAQSTLGAQSAEMVTPRQVLSSTKKMDRTHNKASFGQGEALDQADLIAANNVFRSDIPEVGPGTADALIPILLGSGLGSPGGIGTAGLGAAVGYGLSRPGALRWAMGGYPVQDTLRGASPYLQDLLRALGATQGQGNY